MALDFQSGNRAGWVGFATLIAAITYGVAWTGSAESRGLLLPAAQKMTVDRVPGPEGANACVTGPEGWSWGIATNSGLPTAPTVGAPSETGRTSRSDGSAPHVRTARDAVSSASACVQAQAAMVALNEDHVAIARLRDALDACDEAGVRAVLAGAGFDLAAMPGVPLHAVNTKGTGAGVGRSADGTCPTAGATGAEGTAGRDQGSGLATGSLQPLPVRSTDTFNNGPAGVQIEISSSPRHRTASPGQGEELVRLTLVW
jgi:hypothetical protein